MASCNLCNKRVLSHSYQLKCDLCLCSVHLKCLPFVDKDDSIYTDRVQNSWYCTKCCECIFPFNHLDEDDAFIEALMDCGMNSTVSFNYLQCQEKIFVPFELNEDVSGTLFENDPDVQFYNNSCNSTLHSCDYYNEDSFNQKLSSLKIDENSFSMIHINIRSISRNLNTFDSYLENLNHKFPIIALTESWLKDHSVDRYGISGYNSEHRYRPSRSGGGVSLLIQDSIEYHVRENISIQNENIECLFIEIDKNQIGKQNNVIIGVIYRPPDTDIKLFNSFLTDILSNIKMENKTLYFLGDYNVNLLNIDKHQDSQDFADLMYSNSFLPAITKPTRVTAKSATLIDNIFSTNIIENEHVFNGILYTDITDHFPVFYIDYSCSIQPQPRFIRRRIYSQENLEKFSACLTRVDWADVLNLDGPQEAYTAFHNEFITTYDDCFPIKTIKPGYKTRKPWLTEDLKKSIKTKNRLFRHQKKTKNPEHEMIYKKYRNRLNGMLHRAEKEHYANLLKEHQGNLKQSWKILKEVINKKKNSTSCSRFIINNTISTDKKTNC